VELALVLPLVLLLLLGVVQVGLVVRDQILVVHAAREAAREAAVDPAPGAARRAALAGSTWSPRASP
jgi:Flp pilus assembly protein TadG